MLSQGDLQNYVRRKAEINSRWKVISSELMIALGKNTIFSVRFR